MKAYINLINETDIDSIYMLDNTNPDSEEEFMNVPNLKMPNNRYDNMDIERVCKNISRILDVKKDIDIKTFEGTLANYLLNENLYKNQLVKMCYEYNNGGKNQCISDTVKFLNEWLYGTVYRDEFRKILSAIYACIDADNLDDEESIELQELNSLLPYIPKTNERPYHPSQKTFDKFSEKCELFLADIMKCIPKKNTYTVYDVWDIINDVFTDGLKEYSWEVRIGFISNRSRPDFQNRIIYLPQKNEKDKYNYADVRGIIAREIGVHVLRSLPYQNCQIRNMSLGMPENIDFEVGLANAVEQAIRHKYEPFGYIHYLSLGLGMFYGYDFRRVYEIQWRLQKLARKADKQQCFDSVQRAFSGTGELLHLKDATCYNGSNFVWKYITKNINSDTLFDDLFLSGKICCSDRYWSKVAYELKTGWRYSSYTYE